MCKRQMSLDRIKVSSIQRLCVHIFLPGNSNVSTIRNVSINERFHCAHDIFSVVIDTFSGDEKHVLMYSV